MFNNCDVYELNIYNNVTHIVNYWFVICVWLHLCVWWISISNALEREEHNYKKYVTIGWQVY